MTLFFSYEATLHKYALIPEGFRGCLGRRMALIRPDPHKVHSRFLHYYFLTSAWRSIVEANIISGATVDRIPLSRFPDFEIQLPPLFVQQKIASILSTYDDLIENNRQRIALLEESLTLFDLLKKPKLSPGKSSGSRRLPALSYKSVHPYNPLKTGPFPQPDMKTAGFRHLSINPSRPSVSS